MRVWLDFAEGPLFRFAITIMVLGLLRLLFITIANMSKMKQQTHDKSTNVWSLMVASVKWLSPLRWLTTADENRPMYTAMSFIFHLGLIFVPIFFLPHITLWRGGIGFGWWAFPSLMADGLTLMTIATGVILVVMRATNPGSRALSSTQDWLLTPLCIVVFVTGFLAAHPTSNPFSYESMRLTHVLASNSILVLMPFTKLAHVVLLPFTHAVWDLSWKLTPGVGDKVRAALGHQDKPI